MGIFLVFKQQSPNLCGAAGACRSLNPSRLGGTQERSTTRLYTLNRNLDVQYANKHKARTFQLSLTGIAGTLTQVVSLKGRNPVHHGCWLGRLFTE